MKKLNVLLINGSPHRSGNTFIALSEVASALKQEGVAAKIVNIGTKPVQGCVACWRCKKTGICAFADEPYSTIREKTIAADGRIVGTPVYYGGANGALCALLDRIFVSTAREHLAYKPGASVVVCRRGGAASAFDRLNKYFTISNMPVVSSQYWNCVYGREQGEARQDGEGLQTMRTLGRNMAWLLKKIHSGTVSPPKEELRISTHFIR